MNRHPSALDLEEAFRQFVLRPEFPCLGAKAAFNSSAQTVRVFPELGSAETTEELAAGLYDFTRSVGRDSVAPQVATPNPGGSTASRPTDFATFIALFERPREMAEIEFEGLLWKQLRLLH